MSAQGTSTIVGRGEKGEILHDARVMCAGGLNGLVTVDQFVYAVAVGTAFGSYVEFELAAGATKSILGIVRNGNVYMSARGITVETEQNEGIHLSIDLYEDVTCATNIADEISYNVNRSFNYLDDQSLFEINSDPAVITGGMFLGFRSSHILTPNKTFFSSLMIENPYVMRENTKYELRMTNDATLGTVTVRIYWEWYDGMRL